MLIINARQCRTARAWLGWSQRKLASESGLDMTTVSLFELQRERETGDTFRKPRNNDARDVTKIAIRQAFEKAGVRFVPLGGLTFDVKPFDGIAACQAARLWLGWSVQGLAKKADIDPQALFAFERRMLFGARDIRPTIADLNQMRLAFEHAGLRLSFRRGVTLAPKLGTKKRKSASKPAGEDATRPAN